MIARPALTQRRDDEGFTLVELVIAATLTIVVLSVLGGLLGSAQRTSSAVRAATASATLGQLIARSVTQGVANATAVTVTTDPAGDQLLQARVYSMSSANDPTQGNASGVSCMAWYYTPTGGGAIYTKTVNPAAAIAMPAGSVDSSWHVIGNGLGVSVSSSPASAIFATPSGTRVDMKFDVVNGSEKPVHIETTVHIPNTTTVSAPCF